jgi:hypothetical protein
VLDRALDALANTGLILGVVVVDARLDVDFFPDRQVVDA